MLVNYITNTIINYNKQLITKYYEKQQTNT